jgi:CubicO group peptidase (beta-lactamase class C family)
MMGPVSSLLPSTGRTLDGLAAGAQAAGRLPSLTDAVLRDGELLWSRSIGATSYDAGGTPGGPASAATSYRIGSITKSFTVALLLQLRDEGVLALTDPLGDHLPAAAGSAREAYARTRLSDLAAHRSGLAAEPEGGGWWERNRGPDPEDFLRARSAADLRREAGAGLLYSNLAYGLLGSVVEHHRGSPWRDELAGRILTPLGMSATGCAPRTPRAVGYSVHPWCGELMEEPIPDTGAMAPAGQLWSTVADLGRWGSFLADPAGTDPDGRVLKPSSVAQMRSSRGPMTSDEVDDPDDLTVGYGLGLTAVAHGGRVLVGHGGSMPGYLAGLSLHPASRAVAVSFASSYTGYDPTGHADDLLTTLLDAEPTEPAPWRPAPAAPVVRELLGSWWWGHVELVATTAGAEPVLILSGRRGGDSEFVAVPDAPSGSLWRGRSGAHNGEFLEVVRDGDGVATELVLSSYHFGRAPYGVSPG